MNTTDGNNTSFAGISTTPSVMTPANARQFSQALQGALARFIADEWAVNTVGGTGDAITVTAAQGWSAYATGQGLRFQTTAANTTTSVTLNVNSLGAKAVRKISGGTDVALAVGDLAAGETYTLIYRASANSAVGAWVIVGFSPPALLLAGGQTVTGGFSISPNNLGNITSFTINPALGNYQYGTNHGAATWTAPASDCAVDILVTNDATAGSITFSGFTVASGNTGDALTTTNTSKFIVSIRRINGVSTYVIKALQ